MDCMNRLLIKKESDRFPGFLFYQSSWKSGVLGGIGWKMELENFTRIGFFKKWIGFFYGISEGAVKRFTHKIITGQYRYTKLVHEHGYLMELLGKEMV